MTAKEYLSQAKSIKLRLEAMAEQLAFLKSAALYVTHQYSDTPKADTRNIHKSEDAIVKLMDFEGRMKAQYDKLNEINDMVDRLPDPLQRVVLVKHYFYGKTWHEVADEIYYSERTVRGIHKTALAEVEKLLESLP